MAKLPLIAAPAKFEAEFATSETHNGSLLVSHQHWARSLIELMQIGKTPSGADPVLPHAPEAFNGIEVKSTPRRQEMQLKLLVPVGQRRRELMGSVDATAIDDHDHLFTDAAEEGHQLMDILMKPLRIKLENDPIEDFRGAILDGADDAEQHATGHAAPTPIAPPRLAFDRLFTFDLARAQGVWAGDTAGLCHQPARGRTNRDTMVASS